MPKIIIKSTEIVANSKVISFPSGNCPFYLLRVEESAVTDPLDVVEDTAAFLNQYDITEGNEEAGEEINGEE